MSEPTVKEQELTRRRDFALLQLDWLADDILKDNKYVEDAFIGNINYIKIYETTDKEKYIRAKTYYEKQKEQSLQKNTRNYLEKHHSLNKKITRFNSKLKEIEVSRITKVKVKV